MRKSVMALALAAAALAVSVSAGLASASASELPPNWHVHDGQTSLGPQHKGIGFFHTIFGVSTSVYLTDPAACPNATDKGLLPSAGNSQSGNLRAGVCMTSTAIVHLRTVPLGTSGPAGWSWLTTPAEPGYITYYRVTSK